MRTAIFLLSAAFALASVPAASAGAQVAASAKRAESPAPKKASKAREKLSTGTLGSFTPNGATRDFSARLSELERRFSFTPSADAKPDDERVTVGVTRRVARERSQPSPTEATAAQAAAADVRPSAVGAGVDVGYAGFSLSGDYNRANSRVAGGERERVALGLGYAARKWRADVQAGASAPADANLVVPELVGDTVSVEVGGAYALSPRLALRGGVRYDRIHPEAFSRDFVNKDAEQAEDSGTVYLGTSLSF